MMLPRLVCPSNMQAENSGETAMLHLSNGFDEPVYHCLIWQITAHLPDERLITVGAIEQYPINFFNRNGMPRLAVRTFVFNR